MQTENFSYKQITCLTSHRNADIVLSKGMSTLHYGADFSRAFLVMEQLRAQNVDNCAKALRALGVDCLYLEQGIAQNFAEALDHYWPELAEKIEKNSNYVHGLGARA